jgi:hypothetical protein
MTMIGTTTHLHRCPDCGHEGWHETAGPVWCANKAVASGGVAAILCDLCWGMVKPARGHRLVTNGDEGATQSPD